MYSKFTIPLPTSECRLSSLQPLYISIQSHVTLNKQALPIGLDVFQSKRTVGNKFGNKKNLAALQQSSPPWQEKEADEIKEEDAIVNSGQSTSVTFS